MNIITLGTFDLYHAGHANLFEWCRNIAGDGKVVVAVNEDEFIEKFKGEKPIMSYGERSDILSSCQYVDMVVPNIGGSDAKQIIEGCGVGFDLIVIGSDWHSKDYLKQLGLNWEYLEEMELGVCYVPYTYGISSTNIKERLK